MHQIDLSLKELTKVEGAATLDVKIKDGQIKECKFGITEYKRFYTQAMRGKPYVALPQLLARICGTCSNAHLLCSIESVEKALDIKPSEQSKMMKKLTMNGLMIRDHVLHLYLFVLPDLYGKDAFLDFDEKDPEQHQHLHDAFDMKAAGNALSIAVSGRSVHALYPTIGGFTKVPSSEEIEDVIKKLEEIRPAVLRMIKTFEECDFNFDRQTHFMAIVSNPFGYLEGEIRDDHGTVITEDQYREHLEHVVIPYSYASGYKHKGEAYMVGSLARLNLSKDTLHTKTKQDVASALALFPSTNIYHNNLAQAIEVLNSLDESLDILRSHKFVKEDPVKPGRSSGTGVGVIEAPRGTLYHKVVIGEDGKVTDGEIVVPTGQNQINIEADMRRLLEELLPDDPSQEKIRFELEKLIRAYDPCMSCASHFLKVNIEEN